MNRKFLASEDGCPVASPYPTDEICYVIEFYLSVCILAFLLCSLVMFVKSLVLTIK